MARRRRLQEDDNYPARPGWWARFRYTSTVLLALVVILYLALQAMARTAGFRDLVGQRLEARFGMPVKIEDSSVNWRFDLTLGNLVTEGTKKESSPGLRARRLHLAWSLADFWRSGIGLRSVELDRCVMVLARDEKGAWAPEEFQSLSKLLGQWLEIDLGAGKASPSAGAGDPSAEPGSGSGWLEKIRTSQTRFSLQQAEISWWESPSAPQANVQDVALYITPLSVPGRRLVHLKLTVGQALAQTGDAVRNLSVELLDVDGKQMVLGFEAERQKGPKSPMAP